MFSSTNAITEESKICVKPANERVRMYVKSILRSSSGDGVRPLAGDQVFGVCVFMCV